MKLQIINGPNLNLLGKREQKAFMVIRVLMIILKN